MRRRGILISGVIIFAATFAGSFALLHVRQYYAARFWAYHEPEQAAAITSEQPWQIGEGGVHQERLVRVDQPRAQFAVQQLSSGRREIATGLARNIRLKVGWLAVDAIPLAVILTGILWPLFVLMVNAVLKWRAGRGRRAQGFEVVAVEPERRE